MTPKVRGYAWRIAIGAMWFALLVWAYVWFAQSGIPLKLLPRALQTFIKGYGIYGPLLIVGLYVARTFFFLPSTPLLFAAGSVYGPLWGTLLALLGENLSAGMGFVLGRFFGRRYVREHADSWFKKYDDILANEGFMSVLVMRLLYFPYEVVSIGSGMSSITYRQYALATLIGLLPAVLTWSVLGDALVNPRAFIFFVILFVLTLAGAYLLQRSSWVRARLFAKKKELF